MPEYVTDTHALIWHLTKDARLSPLLSKDSAFAGLTDVTILW
jgi:PIN domain nuclease of toxin-antitoxin system